MMIQPKYNIGDRVFAIELVVNAVSAICPGCKGSGVLKLMNGETVNCPKCCGNCRIVSHRESKFSPIGIGPIVIQQVEIIHRSFGLEGNIRTDIRYMAMETGCPSGTAWGENSLFLTEAEAEKACSDLNSRRVTDRGSVDFDDSLAGVVATRRGYGEIPR